jgi:oligoendopeptidase F
VQISSTYAKSYEKTIEVMAQIGDTLPRFQNYAQLFQENNAVKQVLGLFYKDILDFHRTVMEFFSRKSGLLERAI